ncbi:MAG: hypothetical protein HYV62_02485 [Candidatus Rokubacteria bacterium]|nr:hypothetical protein [Candidatus Rokubacteria bacterium]
MKRLTRSRDLTSTRPGLFAVLLLAGGLSAYGGCGFSPGVTRLSDDPVTPPPGQETKFLTAKECRDCHPVHYREWRTSMHAFAQHSPAVLEFINFVIRGSGGTLGSFCTRCHTPIGISAGESPIRPNAKRSEAANDSVGCISCHAVGTRDGQASAEFHVPIPGDPTPTIYGPYYGPDEPGAPPDPALRLIDRVKTIHASRRSDYITEGRFCGSCHDVFLIDGTRLEEAFIEWKNSPYARRGIQCQDCHMSPVPGKPIPRSQWTKEPIVDEDLFRNAPKRYRTNHKFTGPDYALFPDFGKADLRMDDAEFKAWEAQLEEDRKTLFRNAATITVSHPDEVRPGSRLRVRVAVTNSGTGHNLPTGFAAERQVWLEVIVRDATGQQLYASGDLDRFGDLRDHESEEVRKATLPLDRDLFNAQAKFVVREFRGTDSEAISTTNRLLDPVPYLTPAPTAASILGFPATSRIHKHGIPPLATKTATYGLRVPADAQGPLTLSVRLRFRNFPAHLFRDIGIGELRSRLRVIDMQEYEKKITLVR